MSNPDGGSRSGLFGYSASTVGKLGALGLVAQINNADPAALTDLNFSFLSMDSTGRLRAVVSAQAGASFGVVPGIQAESVGQTARVVGPAAGAVIATIAAGSLPVGYYQFDVCVFLDAGAPVAADINNMEFREGATVVTALQVLPVITAYSSIRTIFRVMDGATAVSVNATGLATAGVGYSAQIVATRKA